MTYQPYQISRYNIYGQMPIDTLNWFATYIHESNVAAGWWDPDADPKYVIPTKIALIHSEASEMLEGFRKGLMDDHLPHRPMGEVEAADIFIRLMDLCGKQNWDIGGAVAEKFNYNQTRADHKPEARNAEGGKKI